MNSDKITVRQLAILLILFTIGTTILIVPAIMAETAKQDAWIAAILGTIFGVVLAWLYTVIGNRYPHLTLIEMINEAFGPWLGKAFSLTLVFFAFVTASELVYFMGDFITAQILPETPIEAIHITYVLLVVYTVRFGLVTLVRSAEILFPFFVVLFVGLIVFISPQMELQNLLPVLDNGVKPVFQASLFYTSVFFLPSILFLMFFPSAVNDPKKANRALIVGTAIGGTVLTVMIAWAVIVLGAETTARQAYPSYSLAKLINVGKFLQRIEVIMAIMWFITIYYKMSVYFYVSVTGLAQILNFKEYRSLTLPLGMMLVVLSLIVHPDYVHSDTYDKETWFPYVSTYGLVLPLMLLLLSALRNKRNKDKRLRRP
ncbi:endospore germination permease [Paenibacillus sp. J2TS4]|uniref:GerAB/ArcD/ProY family transporter n=1 Tax=Paenibacillus sp. J2TS4 TaxID=2807194 RepID=UPI001B09BE12|nr:endospore germination permease [Paenibacillus sp. J2TS4]GIP32615.1 germination protein [Paenibacillus sp. J2TS4]